MEEITPKEWLISIIVAILSVALAIIFYAPVRDNMNKELRRYQSAIQINDATQFSYSQKTSVGDVLGFGELVASEPVTFPELINSYAVVSKNQERYTEHERQVCNGYDKKGDCTGYHTEYYYTWDSNGSQVLISNTFTFLGVTFGKDDVSGIGDFNEMVLDASTYADLSNVVSSKYEYQTKRFWGANVGDLRWYYKYLPVKTSGTLFAHFFVDNKEKHNYFYTQTPDDVISSLIQKQKIFTFFWFFFWIALPVGAYLLIAYDYIEID